VTSLKLPFRRSLILFGEVLVVRLTVNGEGPEGDEALWRVIHQETSQLLVWRSSVKGSSGLVGRGA
jgi:hypothetical protein